MIKNNLYAVILAGGSGTRFWPLSRSAMPKQFLPLMGGHSLFEKTLERIKSEVKPDHIYIVGNLNLREPIARQTARFHIPKANVLLEPSGKNTAPAIAWASFLIGQRNPDAVMAVLPSDHLIEHSQAFLKILHQAFHLAVQNYLVTLGIAPTRPETGFGYLKTKRVGQVFCVEQFVEKPDRKRAQKYLKAKNFYWNSGMFVWKARVILEELEQHLPAVYHAFYVPSAVSKVWEKLPSISIDYGVMEKSKRVVCVPARNIGWSDLGSWESLYESSPKNTDGNVFCGNVVALDSKNIFAWGKKRVIAAIGLENLVIVDTDDALLICRKDQSQKVKNIVDILKKKRGEV